MKTVAIVGSQAQTRELAPFDEPDIDIWVFNEAANSEWCKRADAVFQMHIAPIYRSPNNRSDPDHWKWLQQPHAGLTVYMQDVDALVPCSVRYPLDEVAAALLQGFRQGVERLSRRYFTNTIAYALALAIYQGYERILVYGVEMSSETEYVFQRPCVLFWVGLALGRGIQVDFVSGDSIFDVPLYGYDGIIESRPEDYSDRIEELRAIVADLADAKAEAEKRLLAQQNGNLGEILTVLTRTCGALGDAEGRLAENERYAYKVSQMIADGGSAYIDRSEYEMQTTTHRRLMEAHNANVYRLSGAINYIMRAWTRNHDPQALEQIKLFAEQMCRAAREAGKAQGIAEENFLLMTRLDERIRAAGGWHAAENIRGEQWPELLP